MKWIEFLMRNWILVVVFFFIFFSTIRSRLLNAGKQEQQRGPRMPSFGGESPFSPRNKAEVKPLTKQANSQSLFETKRSVTKQPAERESSFVMSAQNENTFEYDNENAYEIEKSPESRLDGHKETRSTSPLPLENSMQKQWVQGMIWSEILGPPRSKKPHRFPNN